MNSIKLSQLLQGMIHIPANEDLIINGLALDSRQVKTGNLFFAYQGTSQSGQKFIVDAVKKGAAAILVDEPLTENHPAIPVFLIPGLKEKVGQLAAKFYHHPAESLHIFGITGTNGKTSCSHFIGHVLSQCQTSCGIIGTLGNGVYGAIQESSLTTPDPITLQQTFAEFVSKGVKHVAMEVSSHSLDQGRVNGVPFDVGIFTNLTRDHLDYHHTMEEYGQAKKKLFDNQLLKNAVINADDSFGLELIKSLHATQRIYAYSIEAEQSAHLASDIPLITVKNIQLDFSGMKGTVLSPWGEGEFQTKLIGQFNLSNLLAVITSLCLMQFPLPTILASLKHLTPVPGRMETLGGAVAPLVVVDYSHTPDSLEKALITLKNICKGKIYCVFGCGGDRDRGKRPIMAKVAEQYSDHVVVTDDNPRTEDSGQIIAEISQGFTALKKVEVQNDRSKAIHDVIQCAKVGDCILIAGKGAETYQIIGTDKIPFSDVLVAQAALSAYGKNNGDSRC